MLRTLFREINASYFAFLGGVGFSISVNLYTSLVMISDLPDRWHFIGVSVILLAGSGAAWTVLAVLLSDLQGIVRSAPTAVSRDEMMKAWSKAYARSRPKLLALFWSGLIAFMVGLIATPLGPLSSKNDQAASRSETSGTGHDVPPNVDPSRQVTSATSQP